MITSKILLQETFDSLEESPKFDKLKRLISDRSTNSEDEEEDMPKLQGLLSKLEENLDDMKNMTVKVEPLDPFEA